MIGIIFTFCFFFKKQNATMTSVAGKKVVYPSGCKEVNEEIGKDELVRRLKVGIEHLKV